ncbi:MAG: site-specific DNA-methyltransferase [Lautropia sp.]|nr:site-specific DNA-methyltransferase [Lautropia sp.]
MKKIDAASADVQSADLIAGHIAQLKALFPELVVEGNEGAMVNVDVLKALVGDRTVTDADEKYGLGWHGKRSAHQQALIPSSGTLLPCPADSLDWNSTRNLMIEGDNLEVLKLLQKSYADRVKLIYIDPPYNTGKDFVYPDNFQDSIRNYLELTGQLEGGQKISSHTESSGRFHTDWLNMMYPRLKLARNLLGEDGVIFMSIDDGEVANLRKLGDEIFGEENFIANVVWQKKYTRSNDAKWFSDNHDHILVYGKNKDRVRLNAQARNDDQLKAYANPDGHPKGPWKATPLHAKSGTDTRAYTFRNGIVWTPPKGTFRRFNDTSMRQMDERGEIWFGESGTQTPQRKSFLSEVKQGVTPVTLWPYREVGHNHEANDDLKVLGLGGMFDNPKPVRLLQRMIQLATDPDQAHIVLDFFAGSGTTAQAVLQANVQDGGNRRFICVQLPHRLAKPVREAGLAFNTIADVCAERIRRAAQQLRAKALAEAGATGVDSDVAVGAGVGMGADAGAKAGAGFEVDTEAETETGTTGAGANEVDLGFRVYRLNTSNIRAWDPYPADLEQSLFDNLQHIVDGRSVSDIFSELLLKRGLDLCVPVAMRTIAGHEVLAAAGGRLIACLAPSIASAQVQALAMGIVEWHRKLGSREDVSCVFRDDAFADDAAKLNLTAILEQNGLGNVRSL